MFGELWKQGREERSWKTKPFDTICRFGRQEMQQEMPFSSVSPPFFVGAPVFGSDKEFHPSKSFGFK